MPRKSKQPQAHAGVGMPEMANEPIAAPAVDEIRAWHRKRCYYIKQRIRVMNGLAAEVRSGLGWSLSLPERDRREIEKKAKALVADGGSGTEFETIINATIPAVAPLEAAEAICAKALERFAAELPAWNSFGKDIRGFGPASLAVIVGEAGDLSNYANPGKLWKRMGLAVMGDVRQGGLAKNASKESWIAHGYNRQRRSRMWNIGDALIKGNRDGEYRAIYLERKAYELARDPQMKPMKAHLRAQRYMEKRLLKNLWQAWRRATSSLTTEQVMPAAISSAQAERSAELLLSPNLGVLSAVTPAKAGKRRAMVQVPPTLQLPAAKSKEPPSQSNEARP